MGLEWVFVGGVCVVLVLSFVCLLIIVKYLFILQLQLLSLPLTERIQSPVVQMDVNFFSYCWMRAGGCQVC